MAIPRDLISDLRLNPILERPLAEALKLFPYRAYSDILIVVDPEISLSPSSSFGISAVIELLRGARVGCMRFRVDLAQRGGAPGINANPAPTEAKYSGFRFDMMNGATAVIDSYEQIWCFGFKPDNFGGPDSNIGQAGALPATDSELAKLASWMKLRRGGVFATGDHDYLGASLCSRIPRVGTMRRWTNADGVPPIDTPDRIDTLRPPSAAYQPGAPGGPLPLGNGQHQGDLTPQPIEWVTWQRVRSSFFIERHRPHPVLCHPTLGPIDIMPDHAHEGLCRDTGTIPMNATYDFGAGPEPEYPAATDGGARPAPTVIAYGSTLGAPPYNFAKGPQPARSRFPMISVYDGHGAGVGRVATDSTWHHWMDINIQQIKNAGGADWAKISRYYINLAVWLNPPGWSTQCLYLDALVSHLKYPGLQEYSPRLSDLALGQALRDYLSPIYGPCWIAQVLIDLYKDLKLVPIERLRPPVGCLSCPPDELFEAVVLGGLVRAGFHAAAEVRRRATDLESPAVELSSLEDTLRAGVKPALHAFAAQWHKDLEHANQLAAELARDTAPEPPCAKV